MAGIIIGALLIVAGVVWAGMATARHGSLSEPRRSASDVSPTLEPKGRGRSIGLKADLPGLALIIVGGLVLAASALSG